eukprot:593567-Pelagomonas_calceolata.AAC.4
MGKGWRRYALSSAPLAGRAALCRWHTPHVLELQTNVSLEEALEARVASVSTKVSSSLSQELDKRFLGLYDHVDLQVGREGRAVLIIHEGFLEGRGSVSWGFLQLGCVP